MGRLLEALRAAVEPVATPATSATLLRVAPEVSQSRKSRRGGESDNPPSLAGCVAESQESQSVPVDSAAVRARLLACVERLGGDPVMVRRLPEVDLVAYVGAPDHLLRGFVESMMDTADREAGRVPAGHTAPMHCARCGPVWAHPSMAAALPMVAGWPRALGCPWCHVRKAGGYIPRPVVSCEGCRHFVPDTVNPEAGMGACAIGKGAHYAMQRHGCGDFRTRSIP